MKEKCDGCYGCYLLGEWYDQVEKTNRNHYIWTELFVLLHGGKDECPSAWEGKSGSEIAKKIERRRANFEMVE